MIFSQRFRNFSDIISSKDIINNLIASTVWLVLPTIIAVIAGATYGLYSFVDSQIESVNTITLFVVGPVKIIPGVASLMAAIMTSLLGFKFYKFIDWDCGRTRESITNLHFCLKKLHKGVRPAVAYMAQETAYNLCEAENGENITLKQYMNLIKQSTEYKKIRDITFLAKTRPSEWGNRDELSRLKESELNDDKRKADLLETLWNKYFDDQKTKSLVDKDRKRKLKMRRIFLWDEKWDEKEEDSLDYLKTEHNNAKIDLLRIPINEIPAPMQHDLVLLIGSDKKMWIIKSNYGPSNATVDTWVQYEIKDTDPLKRLYSLLDFVYEGGEPKKLQLLTHSRNRPDEIFA